MITCCSTLVTRPYICVFFWYFSAFILNSQQVTDDIFKINAAKCNTNTNTYIYINFSLKVNQMER